MHITLLTIGTRGDVQPYVALGLGLLRAGYGVRLATHALFEDFVRSYGLDFAPLEGNPQEQLSEGAGRGMVESGGSSSVYLFHGLRLMRSYIARLMQDCWEACQGTDAIVYALNTVAGPYIAERLNVPCFGSWYFPIHRTSAFPLPLAASGPRLGHLYNRLTYHAAEQAGWQVLRPSVNHFRREVLGLPALPVRGASALPFTYPYEQGRRQPPVLYYHSPTIVRRPDDWPDWAYVTGEWFLDAPDWQPPPALARFLEDGPPPITVGFSSMTSSDAASLTASVVAALERTGQRAVLVSSWGGLAQISLPPNMLQIDNAPFDWLFARSSAVIHHGGAGTTATSLRAGVPTIVVPFTGDQPFWGMHVAELGAGPQPIPQQELTTERLVAAIHEATTNQAIRQQAAALGASITAENGVGRAIELIRSYSS